MALINSDNKEYYIKRMVRHFKSSHTEEELRKNIEGDPSILEDFAEYLVNGGFTNV